MYVIVLQFLLFSNHEISLDRNYNPEVYNLKSRVK